MDLAIARRSGQELHNTYTITKSPEFALLRRFFTAAVKQLQLVFNNLPVPSSQPSRPSATPLLETMHAAVDNYEASSEDSVVLGSPSEDTHTATILVGTSPSVSSADDITQTVSAARRLTPANWSLRLLEAGALGSSQPHHVPCRPAVPDLCIASSRLLLCIDPLPLDCLPQPYAPGRQPTRRRFWQSPTEISASSVITLPSYSFMWMIMPPTWLTVPGRGRRNTADDGGNVSSPGGRRPSCFGRSGSIGNKLLVFVIGHIMLWTVCVRARSFIMNTSLHRWSDINFIGTGTS